MSVNLKYDDTKLRAMYAELEQPQRLKVLKGAFRREANTVRKAAINNLRHSIRADKDMTKGVRAIVFKRKAGFRVTVGTKRANKNGKGEAGYHTNRQGLKKPILIWAEDGTEQRRTKTKTKIYTRARKGHPTGRMQRYAFMDKTRRETLSKVTDNLHNEIAESVVRIANKYGCK